MQPPTPHPWCTTPWVVLRQRPSLALRPAPLWQAECLRLHLRHAKEVADADNRHFSRILCSSLTASTFRCTSDPPSSGRSSCPSCNTSAGSPCLSNIRAAEDMLACCLRDRNDELKGRSGRCSAGLQAASDAFSMQRMPSFGAECVSVFQRSQGVETAARYGSQ